MGLEPFEIVAKRNFRSARQTVASSFKPSGVWVEYGYLPVVARRKASDERSAGPVANLEDAQSLTIRFRSEEQLQACAKGLCRRDSRGRSQLEGLTRRVGCSRRTPFPDPKARNDAPTLAASRSSVARSGCCQAKLDSAASEAGMS